MKQLLHITYQVVIFLIDKIKYLRSENYVGIEKLRYLLVLVYIKLAFPRFLTRISRFSRTCSGNSLLVLPYAPQGIFMPGPASDQQFQLCFFCQPLSHLRMNFILLGCIPK